MRPYKTVKMDSLTVTPDNLTTLSRQLVDSPSAGEAWPLLKELLDQLCQQVGLDRYPSLFVDDRATITARGKAVSAITAAQCADDIERSRVFLHAIYQAITDKLKEKPRVQLLYAGTGPLGWLVLPLLLLLKDKVPCERLRVTFLDIHPDSLEMLSQLLGGLGVAAYVEHIEQADACYWQPPVGVRYDLIVSETMKHLLQQEPQVSVFAHLQSFLADDGELIPQQIILSAALCRRISPLDPPQWDVELGEFFRLNHQTARALNGGDLSPLSSSLPVPDYPAHLLHLKLATSIQVYRGHWLRENQSQLTLPRYRYNAAPRPGSQLHFQYQLGREPDWRWYEGPPISQASATPEAHYA